MSDLNKYLDTVLAVYPDSESKDRLKEGVRAKYDARRNDGMSEAEALGSVIQELDLESMGQTLDAEAAAAVQGEDGEPAPEQRARSHEWQDPHETWQGQQRAEWRRDGGEQAWQGIPPMYGFGGARASEEEKMEMAAAFRKFQPRFTVGIALGVVLSIVGIVLAALAGIYYTNPAYVVIAFFAPVAVAVFLFIMFGMRYSSFMSFFRANRMYEYLSADEADRMIKQEYRYRMQSGPKAYAKESRREAASSVLWLVAVIAFLLLGFLGDLWHPGWIVFLVAAAIQTLISLL